MPQEGDGPQPSTDGSWLREYLLAEGNDNVMLCERGVRSFDNQTPEPLDLRRSPVIQGLFPLSCGGGSQPHGTGRSLKVVPMARGLGGPAGADALMVEVHPRSGAGPLGWGPQSPYP